MKKLFTLIALLTVFLGAKAVEIVDAEVDFSTLTDLNYKGKGWWADEAVARLSLQDGCLHFHSEEATDPSWAAQFQVLTIDAEVGVTYTLHYKIKGSKEQNISFLGVGQTPYGQFQVTTDWVESTLDYECIKADGTFMIQCGDYVGDIDIAYLKVTHEGKAPSPIQWQEMLTNGDAEQSWESLGLADVAFDDMENNMKVCFWTKEKGVNEHNPHLPEIIEEPDGNHAFICRATTADTEGDAVAWDNQIWLQSTRAWKTGEQFRIMFKYKASEPVVTNTQLHKQTPSDYLHWVGVGDVSFTTEWQEFEQVFTVPSDGNGMWSIAFNLNPNVKTPVDFYIDDISWSEMVLEHGLFVAAGNKAAGLALDPEESIELTYDEDWDAMTATVGTPENWVKEIMVSTVRGNDKQFKANSYKVKGSVLGSNDEIGENWISYEPGSSATINLPAAGVWTVCVDEAAGVMMFWQIEGDPIEAPENMEVNEAVDIVIETVEREMTQDEGKAAGYEEGSEELAACTGQPWDNQFFLIANRVLEIGEEITIAFDYKAENAATVGTQNSENAGGYLHYVGLGNIEFGTEWAHFEQTVTIPEETKGQQNSWTFNLSNAKEANKFYIKNVAFYSVTNSKNLIDTETENPANFQKKVGANTEPLPTGIVEIKANKVATNAIFNLAGQRVSKEYKGIAIKNGQKVIIK